MNRISGGAAGVLLALGASACLAIPEEEQARRFLEASSIGGYSGAFEVLFSKSEVDLLCEGEATFSVEPGAASGDPLTLSGDVHCETSSGGDTLGIGGISIDGELGGTVLDGVVAGTFDGTQADDDEVHYDWTGEVQLTSPPRVIGGYTDTVEIRFVSDIRADAVIEAEQIVGLQ